MRRTITRGILPSMSVIDYQAFKYYRENNKLRDDKNTPNYVEHGKILSKYYKKIGEKIIEAEAGVFIEGLGYFSGVVDTKKDFTPYLFTQKINLNRATGGYKFFLIFIPITKDNLLREWVADGSFVLPLRKAYSQALVNGKKFSFNPSYFINKYAYILKKND